MFLNVAIYIGILRGFANDRVFFNCRGAVFPGVIAIYRMENKIIFSYFSIQDEKTRITRNVKPRISASEDSQMDSKYRSFFEKVSGSVKCIFYMKYSVGLSGTLDHFVR